jgi:hypothetical protein
MAVQLINIGNVANDGTGDDLREAFIKVNQNFEELDLRDDEKTTGSNLGPDGEGLFANRINYDLQFKKIVGGDNITLTATDNNITISSESTLTIASDSGDTDLVGSTTLNILGGDGISTSATDNTLTITNDYNAELVEDLTPQLGGNLDAQGFNLTNVGNIDAAQVSGSFVGNLTGLVHGYDMRDWASWNEGWDFGAVSEDYTSAIQFIVANTAVDFGSFSAPAVGNVDLGSI